MQTSEAEETQRITDAFAEAPSAYDNSTSPSASFHAVCDNLRKAADAYGDIANLSETVKADIAEEPGSRDASIGSLVQDELVLALDMKIKDLARDIKQIGDEVLSWHESDYPAETADYYDPTRATILVVDDSATVRKTLTVLLQSKGYNVVTAEDGVEATRLLVDSFPNLILLDINMPRMSGYQLCKLIKAHPETSVIPVVMISSNTFDKIRCNLVRCDDYISKPFEPEVLLQRVRRHINMDINRSDQANVGKHAASRHRDTQACS
jgi:CheY-like chemotaxis protein